MSNPGTALVLGTTGVTGTPFSEQLLVAGWRVYGISRQPPEFKAGAPLTQFVHLAVDLEDAAATREAVAAHPGITHAFYCANANSSGARLCMLTNLLDALEQYAPRFSNINLLQGMKYYGCHLGPFRTPAIEDASRAMTNAFYYAEEDLVLERQRSKAWTWTALRPHSVCGYAVGAPINLAVALAIYASVRRARSERLWFPANLACFQSLFQVMDADILARAAIYVSTHSHCANQAFNVGNGDIFRWQNLWPAIAAWFELEPGGPDDLRLADYLEQHAETWNTLTAKHRLRPFPFERLPFWVRGDYRQPNSRFAAEYDIVADTVKLRAAGFHEVMSSESMFTRQFARYRSERIIP